MKHSLLKGQSHENKERTKSDKRDFGYCFNLLNSCERIDKRRPSFNYHSEFSLAHLENLDPKAIEPKDLLEDESVIDQKLTINKWSIISIVI